MWNPMRDVKNNVDKRKIIFVVLFIIVLFLLYKYRTIILKSVLCLAIVALLGTIIYKMIANGKIVWCRYNIVSSILYIRIATMIFQAYTSDPFLMDGSLYSILGLVAIMGIMVIVTVHAMCVLNDKKKEETSGFIMIVSILGYYIVGLGLLGMFAAGDSVMLATSQCIVLLGFKSIFSKDKYKKI